MLDDLDRSLRMLLVEELPQVLEKIEQDGFDVKFEVPNRDFKSRLTKPTLSLYLYNIQENRDLRGQTWQVDRRNGAVGRQRPAVKLDCSYIVTAWSNEVEDEHRLLTGAARVLLRNPTLPASVLQGALAGDSEVTTEVAQPESMKDMVDIWSVLDNDLRPSVRVTVTVPLELEVARVVPPVVDREIRMEGPGWQQPGGARVSMSGRLVRQGRAVAGARIRADESSATTNSEGEFFLRSVTPGRRTVFVKTEDAFYQFEAELPGEGVVELPEAERGTDGPDGKAGDGGRARPRPTK